MTPSGRFLSVERTPPCPTPSTTPAMRSRSPTAWSPRRRARRLRPYQRAPSRQSRPLSAVALAQPRAGRARATSWSSTLDSKLVTPGDILPYGECVIHGEIYRARPDVTAVVSPPLGRRSCRSASPASSSCRSYGLGSTMGAAVPFWDSADEFGDTPMVLTTTEQGASLARALGPHAMVLMRRHGATVVGAIARRRSCSARSTPTAMPSCSCARRRSARSRR